LARKERGVPLGAALAAAGMVGEIFMPSAVLAASEEAPHHGNSGFTLYARYVARSFINHYQVASYGVVSTPSRCASGYRRHSNVRDRRLEFWYARQRWARRGPARPHTVVICFWLWHSSCLSVRPEPCGCSRGGAATAHLSLSWSLRGSRFESAPLHQSELV
jgi:hypothetical protein